MRRRGGGEWWSWSWSTNLSLSLCSLQVHSMDGGITAVFQFLVPCLFNNHLQNICNVEVVSWWWEEIQSELLWRTFHSGILIYKCWGKRILLCFDCTSQLPLNQIGHSQCKRAKWRRGNNLLSVDGLTKLKALSKSWRVVTKVQTGLVG